ncbi:MAG: PEP-CTERM sorting domain-containing protein [Caldimonas sp.]
MKFVKTLLASAVLAASVGAQATVVGSLGGGFGTFLTLSGSGVAGTGGTLSGSGVSATIVGGNVLTSDQPFADIPKGGVVGGTFLSAGPSANNTQPATMTFATPVSYLSFLWGSPDMYNQLTINSTGGASQVFTVGASSLNFSVTNGDQGFSQYVQFQGLAGSQITSLVFNNVPAVDAFETANFSITPVPEPETYALMLAGLAAMGYVARRRKSV